VYLTWVKGRTFWMYQWKSFMWISWYPDSGGIEWAEVMLVRWEGKCASVLWHGVIDRRLATPPCSRRVDKGVEKGVETLSRFHGSVTGSRSLCHPLASWYMGHASLCRAPPLLWFVRLFVSMPRISNLQALRKENAFWLSVLSILRWCF